MRKLSNLADKFAHGCIQFTVIGCFLYLYLDDIVEFCL